MKELESSGYMGVHTVYLKGGMKMVTNYLQWTCINVSNWNLLISYFLHDIVCVTRELIMIIVGAFPPQVPRSILLFLSLFTPSDCLPLIYQVVMYL